jgi:hypothetical protein
MVPQPGLPGSTYTGSFTTEYYLSTQALPGSGGTVSGTGWYVSGTNAGVAAVPNAGNTFTGFSGDLTGVVTPQTVLMNAPKTVTGRFAPPPPAILSAVVTGKTNLVPTNSSSTNNRQWTISLTNTGPGYAYNAQLFVLMFVQTSGTPCSMPMRLYPPGLPVSLGNLAPNQSVQIPVVLDFGDCASANRYAVSLGYMSNGGASGGAIQLVNQFQ